MWLRVISCLIVLAGPAPAGADDKARYLDLAKSGWIYELRTTMLGRDLSIPVRINGRDLSGAALCLVGDPPNGQTTAVLDAFRALAHHVFGKPLPMRYAGPDASGCGPGRTVMLRLYSGFPPNAAFTRDMAWLDTSYGLGLPRGGLLAVGSPAFAQTFFGRLGTATHLMVQQAEPDPASTALEEAYFRSILVEELFQSFTFGMDVLLFSREPVFLSKLQEIPLNLRRLEWGSPAFMSTLLRTNPRALCAFDVFMMHAVAEAPVEQTNDPAFLDFIDARFDRLDAMAADTFADPRFAEILAPDCAAAIR